MMADWPHGGVDLAAPNSLVSVIGIRPMVISTSLKAELPIQLNLDSFLVESLPKSLYDLSILESVSAHRIAIVCNHHQIGGIN